MSWDGSLTILSLYTVPVDICYKDLFHLIDFHIQHKNRFCIGFLLTLELMSFVSKFTEQPKLFNTFNNTHIKMDKGFPISTSTEIFLNMYYLKMGWKLYLKLYYDLTKIRGSHTGWLGLHTHGIKDPIHENLNSSQFCNGQINCPCNYCAKSKSERANIKYLCVLIFSCIGLYNFTNFYIQYLIS